ncbi:unnamed protein product, partial [Mycena citricolor]
MSYPYYQYGQQQQPMYQTYMNRQSAPSGYMPLYGPSTTAYPTLTPANPYAAIQPQVPFIPPNAVPETQLSGASSHPAPHLATPLRSQRAAHTPLPLKSALKKSGGSAAPTEPTPALGQTPLPPSGTRRRKARKSDADNRGDEPMMREVTARTDAYHMFVTFKGEGELLLENTLENAVKEISEVFKIWPHGLEHESMRGSTWRIKFRNSPWNMNGADVHYAWRLINRMFSLFAIRGFVFKTLSKGSASHPRLIFQITSTESSPSFFIAFLSRKGRRISLVAPPELVALEFGPRLERLLPGQIQLSEDPRLDLMVVDTVRDKNGVIIKPSDFLMQVLKVLVDLRYSLNATIPLVKGNTWKVGSRRELF